MDRWLKSGSLKRKTDDTSSGSSVVEKISNAENVPSKKKSRQYCDSYLQMGFSVLNKDGEDRPQCVLCCEVLSNECMKPSKLRRHFETKHNESVNKPVEYFQTKKLQLHVSQNIVKDTVCGTKNEKAVRASYEVALLIAKRGQPHTIGEDIILPATKAIVKNLFSEKHTNEVSAISVSNSTVKRRIDEMAESVKNILLERLRESETFALQLDESNDISNNANLVAFVRYEHENKVCEDFLFCESLPLHTTAEALFDVVNDFVTKNNLQWEKCVGISTDGAKAMSGKHKGLVARIQNVAPLVKWTHCCIHREALATRRMPSKFKQVLDEAVKIVNFIKARPLNSRLFSALCNEMGSDHEHLLLHSEIRWLSRGKVLTRLFELRDEVRLFLINSKFELTHNLNDFIWLSTLAYLADIFNVLNTLNSSLQGTSVTVFSVQDKIEATIKKLNLWCSRLEKGIFDSFQTLTDFIEFSEQPLSGDFVESVIEHMRSLASQLRIYFPHCPEKNDWMKNPFVDSEYELPYDEEEQLIELSCDSKFKMLFPSLPLLEFWFQSKAVYPEISRRAVKYMLPFATTYLCETTFSHLVHMKNKYRNKLDVEPDLRLKLSSFDPDIRKLTSEKQHQPSH